MRVKLSAAALCVALASGAPLAGDDWPTYRQNNARAAVSRDRLRLPLDLLWVHAPRHRPRVAWPAPAKWDGWHKLHGLKDRMTFDRVFHVVATGDRVFFGSSSEDSVFCLDARTGRRLWRHFTGGPVRLAPSLAGERVLFGSDDGHVYCVGATDGELLWRRRIAPRDRRLPGNGRVISLWPVRSGVVVDGDSAYCAAGVLPWESVYLARLSLETGEITWRRTVKDLPAQGYMLASATRLYITAGRERPVVHDRETGERLYQVAGGGGGTYALLTGDLLLYGPGKTGEVSVHPEGAKDQLASFHGNHMIVSGRMAYLHGDTELAALDRREYLSLHAERRQAQARRQDRLERLKQQAGEVSDDERKALRSELERLDAHVADLAARMQDCFRWRVRCELADEIVRVGDHLVAGGDSQIAAIDVRDGRTAWQAAVSGRAFGIAAAGGRLFVSTDDGRIHCFASHPGEATSPSGEAPR